MFEYLSLSIGDENLHELNEYARKGWKLIAVVHVNWGYRIAYLEKQLEKEDEN
jgi:hypothetical protein